jgi:hypothetical protein
MKKALQVWASVAAPLITARLRARLAAMLDVMEAG